MLRITKPYKLTARNGKVRSYADTLILIYACPLHKSIMIKFLGYGIMWMHSKHNAERSYAEPKPYLYFRFSRLTREFQVIFFKLINFSKDW